MVRRRSQPWIHQWSRPIIGAIAILGFCLTSYLTFTSLSGAQVACGTEAASGGCNDVLSSAYATVFNLPLPLFGAIAYLGMSGFALSPLAVSIDDNKQLRTKLEEWTWLFLLVGATAMSIFSGYLMYVLFAKIGGICLYCITSALFSLSFLGLVIAGRTWEDIGEVFLIFFVVAIVTIIGTLGIYNSSQRGSLSSQVTYNDAGQEIVRPAPAGTSPTPPDGWQVTTTSGAAEIALAEYLTEIGAKKFGAFWCPHCYEQKQLFGKEAFEKIDYIECAEGGRNPQPRVCTAANLEGFPTWDINGERLSGTQTLEQLAEASGYEGDRDFKYALAR